MRIYKTAQGKRVDIAALASQNETVRAVGNMKVNARGDTIDGFGKVVVPATQRVNEMYAQTVGNKSANNRKPVRQNTKKSELTLEEQALELSMGSDQEIEEIKKRESNK